MAPERYTILLMRSLLLTLFVCVAAAQQLPVITTVEHQPLAAQVSRLLEALDVLGEPLPADQAAELKHLAAASADHAQAVAGIQKILDRHCLVGGEPRKSAGRTGQGGPG